MTQNLNFWHFEAGIRPWIQGFLCQDYKTWEQIRKRHLGGLPDVQQLWNYNKLPAPPSHSMTYQSDIVSGMSCDIVASVLALPIFQVAAPAGPSHPTTPEASPDVRPRFPSSWQKHGFHIPPTGIFEVNLGLKRGRRKSAGPGRKV